MSIHSSAIIDPTAKIGKNVSIGPYAIIGPGVEIGDDCKIWPHVVIEHTTLGKNCEVYPQASLGLAPQHLKYKNEPTRLIVGDRVIFREGVTAHRGTPLDQNKTLIGNDCYFMALSHIAHDCRIGSNVILANAAQMAGHVVVGDNVFISGTACVHQFVHIGKGAMLSGGGMASLDLAPFCTAQGDRAEIKGLNIVGLRRLGADRTVIKLIKDAYKTVFSSGFSLADALTQPAMRSDNAYVKTFSEFFADPKRGYMRPSRNSKESAEEELVS